MSEGKIIYSRIILEMPIECPCRIRTLGQDDFHKVDRIIMGLAFDIHNRMGRFFDEAIYQAELATKVRNAGLEVEREMEVRVSHQEFSKSYFADLLVNEGCIYELKTASGLNGDHQKQLLHYLLLSSLNHGKPINFRGSSVESRFVSTRLDFKSRTNFSIDTQRWISSSENCPAVIERLRSLLLDWGSYLEISLYRDALMHFFAVPETGIQPIDIVIDGRTVGQKRMCLLAPGVAWHFSAIREHFQSYETHLQRCIDHARLTAIQWVNFNGGFITIVTLGNKLPNPK